MPGASIDDARAWLKRGAAVLPLPLRSKSSDDAELAGAQAHRRRARRALRCEPRNIGVLLGKPSGDLVDVDCDWTEAATAAAALLPRTAIFGRASSPSFAPALPARQASSPGSGSSAVRRGPDRHVARAALHRRADDGAAVRSPDRRGSSLGAAGQAGAHRRRGARSTVRARRFGCGARAARVAQWLRHELALAVAGAMLGSGWSEDEAAALVEAASQVAGDLELADRLAAVRTTAEALRAGQPATGLPTLARLAGEELVGVLKRWLHLGELHGVHVGDGPSDWVGTEDGGELAVRRVAEIDERPVRWLWQNRFARGKLSMIAGKQGLSKSVLTCEVAAIVSQRGLWPLDGTRCELGDVLMLNAEDDPEDTIRPRLRAAGADLERVHVVEGVRFKSGKRRLVTLRDVELLDRFLARHPGRFRFLVADPVGAFLAGKDSHKDAEVRELLAPLKELAERHDLAVLLVAHLNKAQGMEAIYRVLGSVGFTAAVRSLYILAPDPDDRDRLLLLPEKQNVAPSRMLGLAYRLESVDLGGGIVAPRVRWIEAAEMRSADEVLNPERPDREAPERDEAEQWLRERLKDGPAGSAELRQEVHEAALGFSWPTVERAKCRLGIRAYKEGKHWFWGLPDESRPSTPSTPSPSRDGKADGDGAEEGNNINLSSRDGDGLDGLDGLGEGASGSPDEPDADVL